MNRIVALAACVVVLCACGATATTAPTAAAVATAVASSTATAITPPTMTATIVPTTAVPTATATPTRAATSAGLAAATGTAEAAMTTTSLPAATATTVAATPTSLPTPTLTGTPTTAPIASATAVQAAATVPVFVLPTAAPAGSVSTAAVVMSSAPQLEGPPDGETVERGASLSWQAGRALADDEYYVLAIAFSQGQETWYDGAWLKETSWTVPDYFGAPHSTNGWYEWKVVIMRQTGTGSDGKPVGEAASDESRPRRFLVNIPGAAPGGAAPPPTATPCGCY
ncbi:MAG: hypothetical protein ACYC5O_10580 [Anaerolineae bacterium]